MLCEECQKNEAAFSVTITSGGETTTRHLCGECMQKMEVSLTGGDISGFLSSLLSILSQSAEETDDSPVCSGERRDQPVSDCENAIAVSGRVRLARNYPDLPFSSMERPEDAESCIQRASQAMHTGTDEIYTLHLLRTMTPTDRMSLVDAHLISRDLLKHSAIGAALYFAILKLELSR